MVASAFRYGLPDSTGSGTFQGMKTNSAFDRRKNRGLLLECWQFLWANRLWWMLPLGLTLLLLFVLVLIAGFTSGAAPFIYTLF